MKLLRSFLVATAAFVLTQAADAQQIISAYYGRGGRGADVTGLVQNYVNRGQNRFQVTNRTMGGDPLPGVPKALRVTYRTPRGEFTATAVENGWIRIGGGGGGDREGGGPIYYEDRASAELRLRNNTAGPVRIYALDGHGNWRWITSLEPGARYSSPATPGRYFVATDAFNREIKRIRVGSGRQSVSIP